MPEAAVDLTETVRELEARVEALERWRDEEAGRRPPAMPPPAEETTPPRIEFDLALAGRTLIILGGAFFLRAVTESGAIPVAAGVALGLLYAMSWSLAALRPAVTPNSALYHAIASAFTAIPLIVEATKKFHVFGEWAAAFALAAVSALVIVVSWRRRLAGAAWTVSMLAIAAGPVLMLETKSVAPFALVLIALGVAAVWIGYVLDWPTLRWIVAAQVDTVLLVTSFLVAMNHLNGLSPAAAIAVNCFAFAAYIGSFAVRTLVREREVIPFEIAQTVALLVCAIGGAMWVAASRVTAEIPLAIAILLLGAGSYAVSFAFIPRHFESPANFVSYSTLALMLIVAGGAFISSGLAGTFLWVSLAMTCGYFAGHHRKSSLALHAAVYLFAGFAGSGVLSLGLQSLFLPPKGGWTAPQPGAVVLLVAVAIAAMIPPIERKGTFELWTAAKIILLAELGWIAAALAVNGVVVAFLALPFERATVAVVRTAAIAALAVAAAWAARFTALSPARLLCNPLLALLVLKLLAEDLRVGRPATLFASLAIAGAALIATPKLRRRAQVPLLRSAIGG